MQKQHRRARRRRISVAGANGHARSRRDGRRARAASGRSGGATAIELSRPDRELPVPDRRHPRRARRGLAGVDAAIGDELGILPLRELVQSGPGPRLLRLPRASACALPRASRGDGAGRGDRLRRVPALRAARAEQQDGSAMASASNAPCRPWRSSSRSLSAPPMAACSAIPSRRLPAFRSSWASSSRSPRSPSFSSGRERRRRRTISACAG